MNISIEQKNINSPLPLSAFAAQDPFWTVEAETVRREVLPYQWNALNDRIPDAAKSYCMRNYKTAAKLTLERKQKGADYKTSKERPFYWGKEPTDPNVLEDEFYGFVFQDSDFSKWIEAVSYSLIQHPDPELEKTADEAIDIVCSAQQENGYLDTFFIISGEQRAYTDLQSAHELYCLGHLIEGAVAYYKATGKDKLLNAAKSYADITASVLGPGKDQKHGYPGHEIAEMALAKLYEATGETKYLELSKYFIDERGKRPYYFDIESGVKLSPKDEAAERYTYHQANKPVREMSEATGHAVRAVYLYSGMADVARLTRDEELLKACERLWENITEKRMYVTGGIGSTHLGEAFSFDYDLPNDTAYSETCAAIGLIFFAHRMLRISPDRKYSDVMERALYNAVLSGMALDGKSFFYVNPLEVFPTACKKDERKAHVKPVRQKWFGCACCPPNIARLLSSISSYAYTENEDTLFFHLYIGGRLQKSFGSNGTVTFDVESGFPFDGSVTVTAHTEKPVTGTIALRVPGWCKNYTAPEGAVLKDGYLYITKTWNTAETITLSFPMDIRLISSNTNVRENAGKLCIMRGPLVYCLEQTDNGPDLQNLLIDPNGTRSTTSVTIGGRSFLAVNVEGRRIKSSSETEELYTEYTPYSSEPVTLTFVPYFSWNNRGEGEMTVWVRTV